MKQYGVSCAAVLLTLGVPAADLSQTEEIFSAYPGLTEVLGNPTISETEKFRVIDRLFPSSVQSFLKVICRSGQIAMISEIMAEYHNLDRQQKQCAYATLEYVTPLTDAQLAAMKQLVCAKTGKPEAELELHRNPALLGGFLLRIGDETFDRSVRRSILKMRKSLIRR